MSEAVKYQNGWQFKGIMIINWYDGKPQNVQDISLSNKSLTLTDIIHQSEDHIQYPNVWTYY